MAGAYDIQEVDGCDPCIANVIHRFNDMAPKCFPALTAHHLQRGYWWLVYSDGGEAIAFAGMVPMEPFPGVGYLKRAFVLPEHRGHSVQVALLRHREVKAKRIGWTTLVSECASDNFRSAASFLKAGYVACEPEQRWGAAHSLYWRKAIA